MSQGKSFKYLRYAIGEIALVVIGILIALQINNWNLENMDRRQEVKILQQLQADLRQNQTEIEDILRLNADRLRCCDSIHAYWQEGREVNDSLRLYFESINTDALFNNAQTTYQYIQNQGTNFLTNDSLRDVIIMTYERDFENIFTRESMSWKTLENEVRPSYNRQLRTGKSFAYPGSLAVNDPIHPEALWKDNSFVNAITNLHWILSIRVQWLPVTLEKMDQLQSDIDAEIERLSSS